MPARDERAQLARRRRPGATRRRLASQLRAPRPAAPPGQVGDRSNSRYAARSGQQPHQRASRRSRPRVTSQPVAQPAHAAARPRPAVSGPSARACRRTVSMRWTTVIRLASASSHEHDRQDDLTARRARRARSPQDGDQPVGPLGDADVGRHARGPRRGPWRRTRRCPRIRQARASEAISVSSPSPAYQSTRPPKIAASPTRSRVESRNAPQLAGPPGHPGHRAVDHVGEDEHGDHDRAPEELVRAGRSRARRRHTPSVPTRVTTSGLIPSAEQEPGHGREEAGEERPREAVQHVGGDRSERPVCARAAAPDQGARAFRCSRPCDQRWHAARGGREMAGDRQAEHAPEPPAGHRRPTGPTRSATSCWSATPEPARPRSSRPCSSRPARSTGPAGSRTAPRSPTSTRPSTASSARSPSPSRRSMHAGRQGQPARRPGLRRLRRRPAGRAARRRRRAVRRLGGRRRRRRDPAALGGVRRGRHAARRRHHQARPGPRRLRRGGRGLPAGVRRGRAAALPAGARRRRDGRRPDRPAVASRSSTTPAAPGSPATPEARAPRR